MGEWAGERKMGRVNARGLYCASGEEIKTCLNRLLLASLVLTLLLTPQQHCLHTVSKQERFISHFISVKLCQNLSEINP